MKATLTFLPKANSPSFIDWPSAITSPFSTRSPTVTIGLCMIAVALFERKN
ncbi:hypothetical protein EVA_14561 [gut metagenome]|uniref:Uncharacterized protein n=1 Tax=gut metagenome TaxID=749906 RepID=J9G6B2_9ZZZZ